MSVKNILQTVLPLSVESISLYLIDMPFVTPFSTSSYTWNGKEAVLLSITADGVTGWGECVADPDPFYSPETTVSCRYIIKYFLLPLIKPGITLEHYLRSAEHIRGNQMAKATVENALLDLLARRENLPLYKFLGFSNKRIFSGISLGIQQTPEDLIEKIAEAQERKYHRVKMKIKRGSDIRFVEAVRNVFPELQLMADANGDYSLDDAETLAELDHYQLTMIEQPLSYHDIYFHSLLQKKLQTSLCLDESIHNADDATTALDLQACRVINIKQGRVGGIIAALHMAELCASRNIPVWSGGMDETGIGRAFNLHLQTSPCFSIPGDTSETARYFSEDIVEPGVTLDEQGYIGIPDGPGTGITVIEKNVHKFLLEQERLV